MPVGIDTFQIDCKLLKLFSICLKGFFSLCGLHVRYTAGVSVGIVIEVF